MSLPVIGQDPGGIARLEYIVAQPATPHEVFNRLTAEKPETLREIAKAWQIPVGRFVEWFATEHGNLFESALRVRADELANEALSIADEQSEVTKKDGTAFDPDVPRDRLRVDTRLKIASLWDRNRYGTGKDAGGGLSVKIDRSCGGTVAIQAGDTKVVITSDRPEGRVLEHRAEPEELTI